MTPESLKVIAEANIELSSFLSQASVVASGQGSAGEDLRAIEARLPEIAAILEKAGHALGPAGLAANADPESGEQRDLYARNLRRLKTCLTSLQAQAEMRRRRLAKNTGKIRETLSWLSTLQSTETD